MKRDSSAAPAAPRIRERFRAATAGAILEAAEKALAEEGLMGAKIETIAAHAGVAVGTVYNHYSDRAGLIAALLDAHRAALLDALDVALASGKGKPWPEQLESFLRALLTHIDAHRAFLTILVQDDGGASLKHASARVMADELDARLDKLIARGLRGGHLRAEHAALYPAVLFGMIRGLAGRELRHARGADLASYAPALGEVFLRGAGVAS